MLMLWLAEVDADVGNIWNTLPYNFDEAAGGEGNPVLPDLSACHAAYERGRPAPGCGNLAAG